MNDWPTTRAFLRSMRSLSSLSDAGLEELRPCLRFRRLAKGEYVYHQGQGTEYLYFIRQGRVKVSQRAQGREMILGFYGAGELLGCCGLIGDVCYPCYAEATEPTDVIFVSREVFHRLLSQKPTVAAELLGQIVRRLREAHGKMRRLALEPVEERVVSVMVELAAKFGDNHGGQRSLPAKITRQQISEMAGTTLETTSRVISKLRKAGLVECTKRQTLISAELFSDDAPPPSPCLTCTH